MRKKIFSLLLLFMCTLVNAQIPYIKTSIHKNNYWTDWKSCSSVAFRGNWSQMTAYNTVTGNTSTFYFRLTINGFSLPDNKTKKSHLKTKSWYEYSGSIEYWIDDEHLDFISTCSLTGFPIDANPSVKTDNTPSIIKKSTAIIKISPYKKYPEVYNVWFDDIGFAFSMCGQHF